MAEVILPGEEETSVPEIPGIVLEMPGINSKVIKVSFDALNTRKTTIVNTSESFFTTDTDAWLEFTATGLTDATGTYSLVLRNRDDGSTFQRVGNTVDGKAYYKIPEQEIRHAGRWIGQMYVTLENGQTTAAQFSFRVDGHILDGKDVRETVVEDFQTLMAQLQGVKGQAEIDLADLKADLSLSTVEAEQLIADTQELKLIYDELLETGVLQTNINEKLTELETTYAPRLTNLEQKTADLTAQLQQAVGAVTVDSEVVLARGGEPTLGVRLDKQDDATKDITSRVNYIEGYIDYRDDDIVGIEADFANRTFTRIAASSGLSAGSDFNAFEPFGGRRRCTVSDNGTVTSYFGDANFVEDGSIGQVMVEQPKFYYKVVPLKLDKVQDGKGFHLRKARYYVSAKHKAGFKIHPAFVRNGKETNFIYLSAYEGAIYDESAGAYILDDAQVADFATDKLSSISGTKPASGLTQNLTRANTRKLAQNRGLGWEQAYGATVAATQLLFAIEYASFNTQTAIGMGVTKTDDGTTNMAEPTGATTLLGNASGKADNGSITYRGEENFWMNIWKWVDGLNIEAKGLHNLFVADNAFADDLGTTPYQDAGITLAKTSGYISAFAYNEKFDWLFFPSETSGNSSVPVGDNFYQNSASNSWLTARLGGDWYSGTTGGGFYWSVSNAASTRSRVIGGRLVYVPGVVA